MLWRFAKKQSGLDIEDEDDDEYEKRRNFVFPRNRPRTPPRPRYW